MSGRLYSVGKEIISMDWVELSLTVLSKTRDSALAEVIITIIIVIIIIVHNHSHYPQGCVGLSLGGDPDTGAGGDMGFFFLSGDFYSLAKDR